MPFGLESLLLNAKGSVRELSNREMRMETACKPRCVVIVRKIFYECGVYLPDFVCRFRDQEQGSRSTVFESVEACERNREGRYLLCGLCEGRNN